MFTKIVSALAALCVLVLAWVAISEGRRADRAENFIRTQPARAARHKKTEPDLEETEQDLKQVEPLNTSHAESN